MADEQAKNDKPSDPMDVWRQMRDASMSAWSKAMIDTVNTEQYAEASGAVLDMYLTNSAPFRAAFDKTMQKALEQCSMPSRNDFISLADRITNVELRLDDMDAKLDRIEQSSAKAASVLQKQIEKQYADMEAKLGRIEQAVSKAGSGPQAQVEKHFADMVTKLNRIEQAVSKPASVQPKPVEKVPLKKSTKKGELR